MGCFGSSCSFQISNFQCSSASIATDCFRRSSSRSAAETSLACLSTAKSATLLAVWWSIWIRRCRSSKGATQDSLLTHSVGPPSGPRASRIASVTSISGPTLPVLLHPKDRLESQGNPPYYGCVSNEHFFWGDLQKCCERIPLCNKGGV